MNPNDELLDKNDGDADDLLVPVFTEDGEPTDEVMDLPGRKTKITGPDYEIL